MYKRIQSLSPSPAANLIVSSRANGRGLVSESLKYLDEAVDAKLAADFILQTSWYEGASRDNYRVNLVIEFAEASKGISFYLSCTREAYRKLEPDVHSMNCYYHHPFSHFRTKGKYKGPCARALRA